MVRSIMLAEMLIACTIAAESIGEGPPGREAVASVMFKRSQDCAIPITQVCLQPAQFSCWIKGGEKFAVMEGRAKKWRKESPESWRHCVELARQLNEGRFVPMGGDWNHYYNPSKASPFWAKKLTGKVKIGNHVFGRIENEKPVGKRLK
ncbi:MAG: cell wall hydrolase [Eubacteriales bacterium]|jgi:spore germination cell wall hydrolase CwlJ-like protein